jgi:glycosyltransferase involved in cell wall biosynthesis
MNVLLLTTHLDMGGVAIYTVKLANYLKDAGIEVSVASSGGILENVLEEKSIPHIRLDLRTKFEFSAKMWRALSFLTPLVKKRDFDLIHAQTRVTQVLAGLLELKTGIPFVSTCHGFFRHQRLGRKLFPCWGKRSIAISNSVRKHLAEDFGIDEDRIDLVYNGIELDRYTSPGAAKEDKLRKKIGLAEDRVLVGTVGRLSSVKGLKYLVQAFEKSVKRGKPLQLLLVGEGNEKGPLEEQVRRAGIADKVFFDSGNAAPLEKYLSLIDIFCLYSTSEGLGLALMEAMAAGRACIASNVGGLAELITQEKDGIIVPPRNPEALSGAILRLAEDNELRREFGKAAHEKAMSNFSIKESVAKTIEVYKKAIGHEA